MKLYKGFSSPMPEGVYENIFKKTPRNPVDTPESIHLLSDEWFFEKFLVRARSSTLICTTDITQAALYSKNGTLAEITPCNPCKFMFSKSVKDFLSIVAEIPQINKEEVTSWLSNMDYQIVSVQEHLPDFFGEILVDCSSFTIKHVYS